MLGSRGRGGADRVDEVVGRLADEPVVLVLQALEADALLGPRLLAELLEDALDVLDVASRLLEVLLEAPPKLLVVTSPISFGRTSCSSCCST